MGAIDFSREIEGLKRVERRVKVPGTSRHENPAEHSWQLCLMAHALAPFAVEPVDVARVVEMLLVHDIGEIDTGDVIAFDLNNLAGRKLAEEAAVRRIVGLIRAEAADRLTSLWQEFEAAETAEARFAQALDRAAPVLINLAQGGQSWRDNHISYERVVARIAEPIREGCPLLWTYLEVQLEQARAEGLFGG